MSNRPKYKHYAKRETLTTRQTNTVRREREVRDLFNRLMGKYRSDYVFDFFHQNYFITQSGVYEILKRTDKVPVDITTASIQYKTAIKEDFNL